jgi:hypothetical protein
MVGHEAVVVECDAVVASMEAHELFEVCIVIWVIKHDSLLYTSVDDMVVTIYLYARFSGHGFSPLL